MRALIIASRIFIAIGASLLATALVQALGRHARHAGVYAALGGGALAIGLVLTAIGYGVTPGADARRRRRRLMIGVFTPVGLIGLYVLSSLYWRHVWDLCGEVNRMPTMAERRQKLEEARAAEVIPLHLFRRLVERQGACSDWAGRDLERDEALVAKGECPFHWVPGVACRCGDARVPADTKCARPMCYVRAGGTVHELHCAGD